MSDPKVLVATAALEDLPAIEALTAEAVPTAFDHPDLTKEQRAENAKLTEIVQARCLAALENPDRTVLVAKTGEEVLGFVLPKREAGALPEIVWLIVAAAYHGRGVAQRLLEEALAWIGPGRRVTLSVLRYNHRAIAFYSKFGFLEDGRPEDDHGLPLIRMTRPKTP